MSWGWWWMETKLNYWIRGASWVLSLTQTSALTYTTALRALHFTAAEPHCKVIITLAIDLCDSINQPAVNIKFTETIRADPLCFWWRSKLGNDSIIMSFSNRKIILWAVFKMYDNLPNLYRCFVSAYIVLGWHKNTTHL